MHDHINDRYIPTKLIATLGPASAQREVLERMLDVGLDACRLNFSHGTHEQHEQTLRLVREVAAEHNEPICVIGDLCGPKIRLGQFTDEPMSITPGQELRFVRGDGPCNAEQLTVSYARFIDEVEVGQRVLIDDGLVSLVARQSHPDQLICECTVGGELRSHKGINLPDSQLSTPALTAKDREDLAWALEHELDYVALSFVREAEDLYELKRVIKDSGRNLPVVVKIEKPEALLHLDELIAETDAVLVARGDLGVETDIWRVPLIQKDIIARCQAACVPVIVATQMLQSMISSPMPTRAEVSDVANAIFDRADAVMLSGETAVGKYPVESVNMMNKVATATGAHLAKWRQPENPPSIAVHYQPTAAVAHAAVQAAQDLGARLIAVWTATGNTARRVARHRLPIPVIALTYDERVQRQLNLLFGVVPILVKPYDNPREMATALDGILIERGLGEPGDIVVVATSTQPTTPGATDTALVHRLGGAAPSPTHT